MKRSTCESLARATRGGQGACMDHLAEVVDHAFATTTLLSENFHGTGLQNARSTGRSEYRALEHVQQGDSGYGAHRAQEQDLALRTVCPT